MARKNGGNPLTKAEWRALEAYVAHPRQTDAAKALDISVQTLKNHMASINKKLDTRRTHQSVYELAKLGGVDIFESDSLTASNVDLQSSD